VDNLGTTKRRLISENEWLSTIHRPYDNNALSITREKESPL